MTEETFTRELERRAGDVQGAPLTVDDVRRKARSIRRRRRAGVMVAAAVAVAAISVPFAVTGSDGSRPEPAPARPTPSPTQVDPDTAALGSSVLHDGELTRPDGTTVALDVDTTDSPEYAVLADGRVVVAVPGKRIVRVYGADGVLVDGYDVDMNTIAVSHDHTLVAWLGQDFRVVVLESGRTDPVTYGWQAPSSGETYWSVDAVTGTDCAAGGCAVMLGDYNTTTHVLTDVDEDPVELATSEPLRVTAIYPGDQTWAVQLPAGPDEQFGCSAVYDRPSDTVTARSCDATVWSWSPDGLLVTSARGDNGVWSSVEVLDRGLEPVLGFEPEDGYVVKDWGWGDPAHLLVAVGGGPDDDVEWSLLRVPVDGSDPEVVDGPVAGPHPETGSVFAISE